MKDTLKFKDLSKGSQAKALNNFVPFYMILLHNNELDVMTVFDANHVMADINRTINDVSNQNPDEIAEYVINFNHQDLVTLMTELPQTYFENGNPATDWREWYTKETTKLDPHATI